MTDSAATPDTAVRLPRDPVARRRLMDLAGLTEAERHAIDQWCYDQEVEYRKRATQTHPNCCCHFGAAVAGEWPEFECRDLRDGLLLLALMDAMDVLALNDQEEP